MWVWLLQEIVKSPLIRPLMHFLLKTQLKEVGVVHFYQKRSQKHVLNQLSPYILRTQLRDPHFTKTMTIFNNTSADFVLMSADVLLKMVIV